MALVNTWWIWCVLALCCAVLPASAVEERQAELFIFNELCALKEEAGPCKAIKERFFFDIDAGRCKHFEYGGCGGNANQFETLEDCEETCVVSADKSPCHLEEATGPCRGLVTRYFFDGKTKECKHFFYGGCFGNANNFRSMAECQAKCQKQERSTKAPEVSLARPVASEIQPLKVDAQFAVQQPPVKQNSSEPSTGFVPPEACLAPVERGTCEGAERRFAFNPSTRKCHAFRYSGCGGNKNNFVHKRRCMKTCMNLQSHRIKTIRIKKKNINNVALRQI